MSSVPRLFADDTAVVSADFLQNLGSYYTVHSKLSKINTWMNQNKITINPSTSYALITQTTCIR